MYCYYISLLFTALSSFFIIIFVVVVVVVVVVRAITIIIIILNFHILLLSFFWYYISNSILLGLFGFVEDLFQDTCHNCHTISPSTSCYLHMCCYVLVIFHMQCLRFRSLSSFFLFRGSLVSPRSGKPHEKTPSHLCIQLPALKDLSI